MFLSLPLSITSALSSQRSRRRITTFAGLRAELLGRGNKNSGDSGHQSGSGRGETVGEGGGDPKGKSQAENGWNKGGAQSAEAEAIANAAGGSLTADVVHALSNAISCLSPQAWRTDLSTYIHTQATLSYPGMGSADIFGALLQAALQSLVIESNLLVRQLSAPLRVQTATTAMLCSNAIARSPVCRLPNLLH